MRCLLCGYSTIEPKHCSSCPLTGKGCALSRCPNCGYAFPPESSLINFFKALGAKLSKRGPARDDRSSTDIFQ